MTKQKNQSLKKVWYWIKIGFLLLGIISGSILIYNWWTRRQKLERLQAQLKQKEREAQQHYQEQRNYLELTANLAKS